MKKIIDIIFLSRPVLLIPVFVFITLGYLDDGHFSIRLALDPRLLYHLIFYSFIMFFVHLTNNINDAEVDRENSGPGHIDLSTISLKSLYMSALFFAFAGMTGAVLSGDVWIIAIYASTLVLGFLYNFRPFYFTGRPFLDFLSCAIEYGIFCYLIGKRLNPDPNPNLISLLAYFTIMVAGTIASTTTDVKGDKKGGKITTAVYLGVKKALVLGTIFLVMALFFGIIRFNPVIVISSGLSIVVFLYAILFNQKKSILACTYQIGGGVLIILAHIFYPVLFVITLFLLGITMVYFKLRHNAIYPRIGY
jgi:4-hydroxybenzoate polyprenyltransferase